MAGIQCDRSFSPCAASAFTSPHVNRGVCNSCHFAACRAVEFTWLMVVDPQFIQLTVLRILEHDDVATHFSPELYQLAEGVREAGKSSWDSTSSVYSRCGDGCQKKEVLFAADLLLNTVAGEFYKMAKVYDNSAAFKQVWSIPSPVAFILTPRRLER